MRTSYSNELNLCDTMEQHAYQKFELHCPIVKSEVIGDPERGPIRVYGVFTDESTDLDNSIVKAAANPDAFGMAQKRRMKFNYNHGEKIVGDVHAVRFLTKEEATAKYGHHGRIFKGIVGELEGIVHPLTLEASDDLKETRHLLKCQRECGSTVGFSMQGEGRYYPSSTQKGVNFEVPTFIPLISITPIPKNGSSICIVKSLTELAQLSNYNMAEYLGAHEFEDALPEGYAGGRPKMLYIAKALDISGIKAEGGTMGADALKIEDGSTRVADAAHADEDKERTCARCGVEVGKNHKFCAQCGTAYKSTGQLITELARLTKGGCVCQH